MEKKADITVEVFGKTDVGLIREHNEDNFLIANVSSGERTMNPEDVLTYTVDEKGLLFLVCDGMGGAAAGEVASTMAVDSISDDMGQGGATTRERFARRLRRAIENANDKIHLQSRINQSERGMGTTCTAVALIDQTLLVGQIGDSRCYVLRAGKLVQITKDQSLAWQLIEAGAMTAEEAKSFEHANIILQALGVQDKVDVVLSAIELRKNDVILVSSDGLHGPVTDDELKTILITAQNPREACEELINKALEREGPDNVTVVVARFDGESLALPTEADLVGFLQFDPGVDAEDPEPTRKNHPPPSDKVTEEVPIRADALENSSPGAIPVNPGVPTLGGQSPASYLKQTGAAPATSKPLLTFVFLTLLAALGGALFLAFQKSDWPDQPSNLSVAAPQPENPTVSSTADAASPFPSQ